MGKKSSDNTSTWKKDRQDCGLGILPGTPGRTIFKGSQHLSSRADSPKPLEGSCALELGSTNKLDPPSRPGP